MKRRLAQIAKVGSLAFALALPVLLPLPAQAQGAHNCNNVLNPACSNSPAAPKSGASNFSSSTAGGGGLGHHHH